MQHNYMMKDLISVLMCVYKEPMEWIKVSIGSILEQSYDTIQFVIIIDNPERQDVVSYLRQLGSNKIDYYVNDRNLGFVKSLNFGIGKCTGRYIARMDADDISLPYRLEVQYKYLRDNDLDLVASNFISIDENGDRIATTKLPRTTIGIEMLLKVLPGMPHPTWLLKKEVYEEVGTYRQIEATEDYDFLTRCVAQGVKMGLVEKPCLYYRVNRNSITQSKKGRQKVITEILKDQIKKGMVYSEDQIRHLIKCNQLKIDLYNSYFSYTSGVKEVLRGKCAFDKVIILLRRFRVSFIKVAWQEFSKKVRRTLIYWYDCFLFKTKGL